MEKLQQILTSLRPDVDFSGAEKLVDDGILDSFDIIALVGEINESFDINIQVQDLIPENFNSARAMMDLITRLQSER